MRRIRGFTLVELMVVIAVAAIGITLAVPSFRDVIERKQVGGAAEEVYEQLQRARSEALKRSKPILVDFYVNNADATDWIIGFTDKMAGCNAESTTFSTACTVDYDNSGLTFDPSFSRVNSSNYRNISMTQATGFTNPTVFPGGCVTTNNEQTCFDFVRGLARTGAYDLESANYKLRVEVTILGHINVCVPPDEEPIVGYNDC